MLLPPAGITWHRHGPQCYPSWAAGLWGNAHPAQLTTCWGLTQKRRSEGTPSCPRRITETIFGRDPVQVLSSACRQGVLRFMWACRLPAPSPGQCHPAHR